MSKSYQFRDRRTYVFDAIELSGREGPAVVPVPLTAGAAGGGTWAATAAAGLPAVTRTSNQNSAERWVTPVHLAGIMIKPISVTLVYSVDNADTGDDVQAQLITIAEPANGSAQAAAVVLAGDADADYDTNHNTAAKRVLDTGAPQQHTLTMTIPSGEQAFLAAGKTLALSVLVTEANDATGALAVILNQANLTCEIRHV